MKKKDFDEKQTLEELQKLFSSLESEIQMPESLKSKNLMHLLPSEPDPPAPISLWSRLTSKKAVPVYITAIAAALMIIILPKAFLRGGNTVETASPQAKGDIEYDESAPLKEEVAPQDFPEEVEVFDEAMDEDAEMEEYIAPPTGGGGEDALESSADDEVPIVTPFGGDTPQIKDEVADDVIPAESQEESASVARGVSPFGMNSYFITEQDGYSFSWSLSNPDETGFLAVLEVTEEETQETYLQQGFPHVYQIFQVYINNDILYVVGQSQDSAILSVFTGFNQQELVLQQEYNILGDYKDTFTIGEYVYVVTSLSNANSIKADQTITLTNTQAQETVLVYILDLERNLFHQWAIVGAEYTTYHSDTRNLVVSYLDIDNMQKEVVFHLNGTTLAQYQP